jgi:hypothetical protein
MRANVSRRCLKCGDSSDALAEDERVDVVRAFVGLYGFEVHAVAHDRVVLCDAVCAQDVAGHAGGFERHPDVVALGQGDVFVAYFASVFEAAYV